MTTTTPTAWPVRINETTGQIYPPDDLADTCPICDCSGTGPLCRNHREP